MNMKEKVARALCKADGYAWPEHDTSYQGNWFKLAGPAIEAMRSPSDTMLEDVGPMNGYPDHDSAFADDDHLEWWEAMIDAALTEKYPQHRR